ncbi:MAG: 4-(cytidine 5'-diphospho)-2-C-methyl-D-erythritol kinase [Porticoccaceae bacterium]|nr:4-(cytidine 5'-diphospho)-2-C-methyl-D-erythritol kinase [Pseudomonadales bacterium]MCP5173384.1 4-(cytidine 5'-diphospho)-2-C-methyl-D-erythritol kinase [Pseudomonadales bacterium]MCP5303196.1 4-(cytidine 5'-diphospho)-2-C-methyl-D-erythritol kinase [Pseudomonadales bacterium]
MKTTLRLPAPAKLNLFLHITGRREDGYHNLQTLFQLLDYSDTLSFECNKSGSIELSPALTGVAKEDNLIYKAARQLKPFANDSLGVTINIDKKLPMGGGLGGGSSNAATTLVGLNHLWQLGLTVDQLASLGRELGADVPVFVHGNSAWAEGIGEQLQAVDITEYWYLVLVPQVQASTAAVFNHQQLTRNTHPSTIRAVLEQGGRNDCQSVAEMLYPPIRQAREWLEHFTPAQMTGTGACIFARFNSRIAAETVLEQKPENLQGFVARGVNRSPLYRALPSE